MRTLLLASVAVIGLSAGAYAQNSNSPQSSTASNISSANTRSTVAPGLPNPGSDLSPNQYIMRARAALARGRTGEAQEALERAETRLLNRSTAVNDANAIDRAPRIASIHAALAALAVGNRAGADTAMMGAIRHRAGGVAAAPATTPAAVTGANGVLIPAAPASAQGTVTPNPSTTSTMMQATSIQPSQPGEVTGNTPATGTPVAGTINPSSQSTMMQTTSVRPAFVGQSTTGSSANMSLQNDDDPYLDPAFTNNHGSMNPGVLPATTPGTPVSTTTPTSGGSNGGGQQ